jgi:hypothetical protein
MFGHEGRDTRKRKLRERVYFSYRFNTSKKEKKLQARENNLKKM